MYSKHLKWYCLLLYILLLVVVSETGLRSVSASRASVTPSPSDTDIALLTSTLPAQAHLVIPKIHVNAPIEMVETNDDGSMQVPTIHPWEAVGWYIDGPYPGEHGSAVIDGHLDRPGGSPAVFWNLHLLSKGDIVQVEAPKQPTVRFRVTEIASYEPAQAPLARIFSNTKGTFLNLITCSGRWIPKIHQTTHRLVVYTKLV